MSHRLDTYKDGYRRIEFCADCGAEGDELRLECVGSMDDKHDEEKLYEHVRNLWKGLDGKKLRV